MTTADGVEVFRGTPVYEYRAGEIWHQMPSEPGVAKLYSTPEAAVRAYIARQKAIVAKANEMVAKAEHMLTQISSLAIPS